MKNYKYRPLVLAIGTILAMPAYQVVAQEDDDEEVETISIVSRSAVPRTTTDSPVPVDVFSADEFNALGNAADVTDNLRALVPSYTATPATGDGSAFVRPTSLRGMAPDQTLVLVNGKRRHRSALVHFFAPAAGNGAHAPDVGMIPGIALKSVEVLRDGAAAQYGSDAIAGVINFQLRDASEGGEARIQYGRYYAGERSVNFSANKGFAIGDDGFFNISFEIMDNDALSRGIQRPDAQALIDAGNPGVGQDSPFDDAPLAQTWGRPETDGNRLFINAGYGITDSDELYFHGGYGDTFGRYRFFYRNPGHSTLNTLVSDFGYDGSLLTTGYTPYLDGEQIDITAVAGIKGEFANEIYYDFSFGYGENRLDYFLFNTTNPSLGLGGNGEPLQRDFNVGGYEQEEVGINADFSKTLSDTMALAFGAEWREETYTINAGETNSYIGAGSNGLGGFRPGDAGSFDRDNYSLYADLEHDISDDLMLQYAVRYEDFSDFGSTVNGKIAGRYNLTDTFIVRGAASTGFHAPTPGQANVRTTITTFDGTTGLQVEEGLVPSTSELARRAGGTDLKEEESTNFSLGFTAEAGDNTTITLDFYHVDVEDRIYRTGDIQVPISDAPDAPETTISFFTNALDVEHRGFDLIVTSNVEWNKEINTDVTFAFNYNEVEITGQRDVSGITPVSESTVEDIENNFPNGRFVLTTNTYLTEKTSLLVRANYYGNHFDERGTIGAEVNPSAEIDSTIYFDLELNYAYDDNLTFSVGAVNVFDDYIDEIEAPFANRQSVGLQYPRRSAANYEGGSWYLRTRYTF